jgi:hypothetical protein
MYSDKQENIPEIIFLADKRLSFCEKYGIIEVSKVFNRGANCDFNAHCN